MSGLLHVEHLYQPIDCRIRYLWSQTCSVNYLRRQWCIASLFCEQSPVRFPQRLIYTSVCIQHINERHWYTVHDHSVKQTRILSTDNRKMISFEKCSRGKSSLRAKCGCPMAKGSPKWASQGINVSIYGVAVGARVYKSDVLLNINRFSSISC